MKPLKFPNCHIIDSKINDSFSFSHVLLYSNSLTLCGDSFPLRCSRADPGPTVHYASLLAKLHVSSLIMNFNKHLLCILYLAIIVLTHQLYIYVYNNIYIVYIIMYNIYIIYIYPCNYIYKLNRHMNYWVLGFRTSYASSHSKTLSLPSSFVWYSHRAEEHVLHIFTPDLSQKLINNVPYMWFPLKDSINESRS